MAKHRSELSHHGVTEPGWQEPGRVDVASEVRLAAAIHTTTSHVTCLLVGVGCQVPISPTQCFASSSS